MAFCLSGDMDMDNTIQLIDDYFGEFEANDSILSLILLRKNQSKNLIVKTVVGPEAESLRIGSGLMGPIRKMKICCPDR